MRKMWLMGLVVLLTTVMSQASTVELLYDDFDGTALDTAAWSTVGISGAAVLLETKTRLGSGPAGTYLAVRQYKDKPGDEATGVCSSSGYSITSGQMLVVESLFQNESWVWGDNWGSQSCAPLLAVAANVQSEFGSTTATNFVAVGGAGAGQSHLFSRWNDNVGGVEVGSSTIDGWNLYHAIITIDYDNIKPINITLI